jgi:hypothetical protein
MATAAIAPSLRTIGIMTPTIVAAGSRDRMCRRAGDQGFAYRWRDP